VSVSLPPALVLTAGLGTRRRPLTGCRAKPAVPVAGTPLIERILRWLRHEGVTEAVLNLHYRPETITACVGDGTHLDIRVRYTWEPVILGTAGGPRRAAALLGDRFLIVNGDTFTEMPLGTLVSAHEDAAARVTLAVMPNPQPDRYGGVLVREGRVRGWTPRGQPGSLHFVGIQVVEADVFAALPDRQPAATIGGLYDELMARDPGAVRAHVVEQARFYDIGTPGDYLRTSLAIARQEGLEALPAGAGTDVHPTARIVRSALWDHVVVEEGCQLTDCVVVDGIRVPRGSTFEGCAIVQAEAGPTDGAERVGDLLVAPLDRSGRPVLQP